VERELLEDDLDEAASSLAALADDTLPELAAGKTAPLELDDEDDAKEGKGVDVVDCTGVMVVNCVTTTTSSDVDDALVDESVGTSGCRIRESEVVVLSSSSSTVEVLSMREYSVSTGTEDVIVYVLVPVEVDVDSLLYSLHA